MNEILNKISSYNLFNYLFPGIVFAVIISEWTDFCLIQNDWVKGIFIYYFLGLVISRFGSLIIEPLLKKTKFIRLTNYKDFVKASHKDKKIEVLSESNNMYRTLTSMFTLVLLMKIYLLVAESFQWSKQIHWSVFTLGLTLLFLISYRKQTSYIKKRIKSILE